MDTEARERAALLRRIDELAQAADADQQVLEGPVLAAALAGLRSELGALRADIGSLRTDLTAARSGVDSGNNRLAGALAAAREETEELGRRQDDLGARVDDVTASLGELRSMLAELRDTVAQHPQHVAAVSTAVSRVDENLGAKVETLADDLRRTLNAGMTQASAGNRAAETAWTETRSILEERLAAVEDTIDGLAERLESVARDSVSANEDHLGRIEGKVEQLSATALPEAVEAQESWAREIRDALGQLAAAVDRSLGSLGDSLTGAVHSTREEERAHVEELVAQLDRRIAYTRDSAAASTADLRGFLESFQEATHGRIEDVRSAIASGLSVAREELVEHLQTSIDALEAANSDSRRVVEEEVTSLRGDLADALEEVRDRIAATVSVAQIGIVNAVDDQRTSFDDIVRTLRADVLDRVEESTATVRTGLDDLRAGVTTAARAGEETTRRLGEFGGTLEQVDAAVSEMHTDWDRRTDAAIDLVAQAGHAAVDEFRDEVRQVVEDLRRSVDAGTESVDESVDLVSGATARLVAAGQALLGYLVRRDQALEQERDRTLHEILDEFAQGLTAKERRGLADRVGEALDRRRDARDADRYRRTAAGEPLPEVEVPAELAALAEPVRPARIVSAHVREPEGSATGDEEVPAAEPEGDVRPVRVTAVGKKSTAKKATAKQAGATKRAPAKQSAAKKAAAKNSAPAKTAATAAKKVAAKRAAAKKVAAKKVAAKKSPPAAVAEPLEPPMIEPLGDEGAPEPSADAATPDAPAAPRRPRKRAAPRQSAGAHPADVEADAGPLVPAGAVDAAAEDAPEPPADTVHSVAEGDETGAHREEVDAFTTEPLDETGTTRV